MSSSASLRDLYTAPSSAWSFVPPASSSQNSSAATASSSTSSNPYQWSTRTPQNPLFDLGGTLDADADGYNVDLTLVARGLVTSALLQYASTAIAMPWEVGKTLLQVQWVPRDASALESTELPEDEEEETESSSEDDSYFTDPNAESSSRYPARPKRDDQGYVMRRSAHEEGARTEYIIPVGSADGVWGMIKRIGRFRGEGWFGLWKGLLTSCINDALSSAIQPLIHNLLQTIFFPSLSPFHQPPLFVPVASHVITGFLLSPLDLVRTRLIVQSLIPRHRAYSGPFDALSQILTYEGGFRGVYLHPELFLPALLDNTLRPLVALALPGILTNAVGMAHISEDTHPLAWLFADFASSCLGLIITLPFETVRRRLQVQVRGTAKPIKTCVETRPAPYNGVVDTLWHILTEERSDMPIPRARERRGSRSGKGKERAVEQEVEAEGWFRNTGIAQLYRGLGMRLGASALVVFLSVLTGGQPRESGWAEL